MTAFSAHDLLAPLAARYGAARGGPVVIPPEPDGVVRAMPIILRLERPPAERTAVLEAAAAAALAVCLDPRAADEWHEALTTWVSRESGSSTSESGAASSPFSSSQTASRSRKDPRL